MLQKSKKQNHSEEALSNFEKALRELPDPRRKQGQRYPLESVIIIALMAMVCGCDDAESMQLWGQEHKKWLCGFLNLPHGSPTQDVFLNVFAALNPAAFSTVFVSWMELLLARLEILGKKHIAIDGKTSRRSFTRDERGKKVCSLHTVSAWMSNLGLDLIRFCGHQKCSRYATRCFMKKKSRTTRKKRTFKPEFKKEVANFVLEEDKTIAEVSRNFDLTPSAVRKWVQQAKIVQGNGPLGSVTTEEKKELIKLRKEIRELRMEREILKKAAAFFAKESR